MMERPFTAGVNNTGGLFDRFEVTCVLEFADRSQSPPIFFGNVKRGFDASQEASVEDKPLLQVWFLWSERIQGQTVNRAIAWKPSKASDWQMGITSWFVTSPTGRQYEVVSGGISA